MTDHPPLRVLLIRLDRMGDLLCTLGCDEVLSPGHSKVRKFDVTWLVPHSLKPILENSLPARKYFAFNFQAGSAKKELRKFLKQNQFDAALVYNAPGWVSWELFRAGIFRRGGVRSKIHSFLFLNKALRQQRSLAEKSEAQYNQELTNYFFDLAYSTYQPVKLKNPYTILNFTLPEKFIVVHPGMGGSALNWPQHKYIELLEEFKNRKVVITGTDADERYLDEIRDYCKNKVNIQWTVGQLNLNELMTVVAKAEKVIAPSTGVAHLAAAMGTPVTTIFSPIQVHSATRWSPQGKYVTNLSPPVKCPAQFTCLGPSCPEYNCMEKIKVPI